MEQRECGAVPWDRRFFPTFPSSLCIPAAPRALSSGGNRGIAAKKAARAPRCPLPDCPSSFPAAGSVPSTEERPGGPGRRRMRHSGSTDCCPRSPQGQEELENDTRWFCALLAAAFQSSPALPEAGNRISQPAGLNSSLSSTGRRRKMTWGGCFLSLQRWAQAEAVPGSGAGDVSCCTSPMLHQPFQVLSLLRDGAQLTWDMEHNSHSVSCPS